MKKRSAVACVLQKGYTPLYAAATQGDIAMVRYLVDDAKVILDPRNEVS